MVVGCFLVLTGIWGIFLFPSDELIRYVHCRFMQMVPDANLSIDELRLSLPPGLAVENIAVSLKNKSAVQVDQIRIRPGILSLFGDRNRQPLSVRLDLTGISLELPLPVIGSFQFKQIRTDIGWQAENVNISSFTAEGTQLDGSLSGEIQVQTPFEKSRLQISGNVILKPETLARLKTGVFGAVIPNPKSDGGGIPFQIAGTLEYPRFSFK
jgi:hypothetical protein